ncbi:MAG: spore coat assembly protein SafA/uncharacterized protein, YkwD family [Parcubacteria group bacterium Licking1014_1]|nr:MAG: spore coat assembly protein SafA/uncharacterized protein, YkwD family [Parcubacteria group bacterium Licking1014_1]
MDYFICHKFLQSRFLLYCVVCLLVLKIIAIGFSINLPPNIFFADITKTILNNLINQNREAVGLQSLMENKKLNQAAELKAKDMVEKGYFSHQSPEGISPWFWFEKVGYNYKYAGENLAIGFFNSIEVYQAWFNSPSHKNNFLSPNYKEVGTAVLQGFGENDAIVVVQLFGSPLAIKTPENISNKNTELKNPSIDTNNANMKKKVLSQEVIKPSLSLEKAENNSKNSLYFGFLNFIIYDYEAVLKNIIFGFLTAIAGALFVWLFYGFNIQHKNILFRSIVFIILLSLAAFFDKELILLIVPHQIII